MISYCIVSFRPTYSKLLISDLINKTSSKYEILVWLNLEDINFENFLYDKIRLGYPLKIIGKSPENIGMRAYFQLFKKAQYELLVQIDDDVVMVSNKIAEYANQIFIMFKNVRQLVADVWQDEYTTGARPPMKNYRLFNNKYGLYDGPIDGWFSIYHRSILPLIVQITPAKYLYLGGMIKRQLIRHRLKGLLCTRFKVFHVIGPQYASYFNMLDFEIKKYRMLGRQDIVRWYEQGRKKLPNTQLLQKKVEIIKHELSQ